MRKIVLLLAILMSASISAQIKVKINSKPVADNVALKAEDIKNFEVAFDQPKKLSYYGTGRLFLGVSITDAEGYVEEYQISKDGTNAVEAFLSDLNVYYTVVKEGTTERDFVNRSGSSNLTNLLKKQAAASLTVKIDLMFFDKIGYNKYGDGVKLVKTFTMTIDNKLNSEAYLKQKEADKIAADAKKAEDDKKAAEAQAEADKQAKAKKKKGLLNSVINKL